MGDQCWFVARAVDAKPPHQARLLWAEPIAAERVRARVPELFRELGLSALCVDAGPLRDLSRDLVFLLNGLDEETVATVNRSGKEYLFLASRGSRRPPGDGQSAGPLPGGQRLPALAREHRRRGAMCGAMAVEFTQREGQGLRHKLARTQEGRLYPLLAANRDETIERVVQELVAAGRGRMRG